jgi:hypothetical protein
MWVRMGRVGCSVWLGTGSRWSWMGLVAANFSAREGAMGRPGTNRATTSRFPSLHHHHHYHHHHQHAHHIISLSINPSLHLY